MQDFPWPKVIAALAAVLTVGLAVTLAVTDEPTSDGGHRKTVTVTIGPKGQETNVALPPAAQAVATAQARSDAPKDDTAAEAGLKGPSPAPSELRSGNAAAPAGQAPIPDSVTDAAPSASGCVSRFVRNQSSRNGGKVALGVIHWTGSRSLPGSNSDVLGIVSWFDRAAAQASSNYIVDDDGNCAYSVPETAKAWTQAAANPWSVSVEYVNPGVLPLFHGSAGRNRVLALMRGWHKRWGIPYRRGAVNGSCVPTRSGFLAHRDLGACGGGHPDVGPSAATVDALIKDAAAGSSSRRVSDRDRADCKAVFAYRQRRHAGKPKSAAGTAAFERRLARVRAHGYRCVDGKVHRR